MLLTKYAPFVERVAPNSSDGLPGSAQRKLVDRARAGDSDAFARLYDFYADRVHEYMYFQVADEEIADDLTARVFLKAWKNIGCYEPDQPTFGAWLYLIARRAVMEFTQSRQGRRIVTEIVSPADEGLEGFADLPPCSGFNGDAATQPH